LWKRLPAALQAVPGDVPALWAVAAARWADAPPAVPQRAWSSPLVARLAAAYERAFAPS
jgi:hypothetical protein